MKPLPLLLLVASVLIAGAASAATDSTIDANKTLVSRWAELINARQFDSLGAIVADNFLRHCPATPDAIVTNRDQFIAYIKDEIASFPDERLTMRMIIAEGNLVAFWATFEGTQEGPVGPFPPLHGKVNDDFCGFFRIENGKLAETWVTWDNVAELTQMGHFPPPQPSQK